MSLFSLAFVNKEDAALEPEFTLGMAPVYHSVKKTADPRLARNVDARLFNVIDKPLTTPTLAQSK
jgi:hypothetical protein